MLLYSMLLALAFLALFIAAFWRNRYRLLPGFLLWCFFCCAAVAYALWADGIGHQWLLLPFIALAAMLLAALLFGLYVLIAALLLNARLMFKRERLSLANSLTLILALALILFVVLGAVMSRMATPAWLNALWAGLLITLVFFLFHVLLFVTALALCNLVKPCGARPCIIVLGAHVAGGKPTRLLAARIDRAIAFYRRQAKKGPPPKLLFSGGQGPDEDTTEAAAMAAYARGKGIPDEDILMEEKAATTAENMAFSKAMLEAAGLCGKKTTCLFATSGYHLLRAGVYARRAGLAAVGIGAKTALYYLPNALIREYIAYFWMRRRSLLPALGGIFLLGVLLTAGARWINGFAAL